MSSVRGKGKYDPVVYKYAEKRPSEVNSSDALYFTLLKTIAGSRPVDCCRSRRVTGQLTDKRSVTD